MESATARKPGRPRTGKEPREVVGISFDHDQLTAIDAKVKRTPGLSRSKYVTDVVQRDLDQDP